MGNKKLVFGQMMILVFGIVAISWAIGSEVGIVSAETRIDVTVGGKTGTYKYYNVDGQSTEFYEKISGEGPQNIGIGAGGDYYILGNDNVYRKSSDIANLYEYEYNSQQKVTGASAVVPTNNPSVTSANGGFSYDVGDETYTDPVTGEIKYYDKQSGSAFEVQQNQQSPTSQEESKSSWSWYEKILGRSGSNTYTLNDEKYKGISYYKDQEGNWIQTKDGTSTKVQDNGALNELNSGKGIAGSGAGPIEVGQYWVAAVAVAAAAKAATTQVAQGLGTDEDKAAALGEGIEKGIQAGALVNGLMKFYDKGYSGNAGTYIGLAVAAWYILNNYKDIDEKSVTFDCSVWEPPKGGQNCEKCNSQEFGCSEYQCKSLGKGCELLNQGTQDETCAWINRNDAQEPRIDAWRNALSESYTYSPDNTQSPPDRGVIIKSADDSANEQSCIPAFTKLTFGIQTDEPATCKIDTERKDSYEDMDFYFGSSTTAKYNHTHIMSLPSINATGTVIEAGGDMSLYVRCEDANGNSNTGEFVFSFCVEPEEDFTAPIIVETDPVNDNPVAYNISSIDLTAYINERATCKWDFSDVRYDLMETTFSCSNNIQVRNAQTVYPCKTTLTGIKDRAENDYYIKCNDTEGNTNKDSTKLTLIGTQPLYIDFAEPNDTIVKGATSPVKVNLEVKTSSGADDGKAYCYYAPLGTNSYVQFQYENLEMNYQHSQQLNLADGIYSYNIKCVDAGGNAAYKTIDFEVQTDTGSPIVVRAYKEDNYLKLITDESSECVYNTQTDIGCRYEFADGIAMQTVDENEHFVEWDSQETYYIKCKDEFDNPPLYNDCSIIARPSEGQTL